MRDVEKTSVKRQRNSKRLHRRTRGHAAYFMLVLLLVAGIGLALSMTLFFNITDIVVENETDTPDEDVIKFSGIHIQDNLVRLDGTMAEQKITASIAYAEQVTVTKQYPSTVTIHVQKAVPIANISQSYGYLLVSGSNRVLEALVLGGGRSGVHNHVASGVSQKFFKRLCGGHERKLGHAAVLRVAQRIVGVDF